MKEGSEIVGAWSGGSVWCLGCLRKWGRKIDDEEDLITLWQARGMVCERGGHCCDHCGESLLTFPEGISPDQVLAELQQMLRKKDNK